MDVRGGVLVFHIYSLGGNVSSPRFHLGRWKYKNVIFISIFFLLKIKNIGLVLCSV
jgi:hypothetical protein